MNKVTDILLVNPHKYCIFPFGIGILSAILKNQNFTVSILIADPEDPVGTAEEIAKRNPRIVGFTGFLLDFNFIKTVSKLTRQKLPFCKQLAGGWWSSPVPSLALEETAVDHVVRGEPDLIIADLCRSLLEEKSVKDFPGVCYKDEGDTYHIKNAISPNLKSMDDLPLPAYELFDMSKYVWTTNKSLIPYHSIFKQHPRYQRFKNKKVFRWFSMYSGRGCYGKCTFCEIANSLRRNHSPQYVVDHMEKMQREYNIDVFQFAESLSLSTKQWVKDFCHQIISRKMNCLYIAYSRGDFNYDDEALALLSESGCHAVRFGFESGDNGMLRSMKKKITVERYYEIANKLHEHQIHVSGSFILNMPGETEESLDNTVNFIKKARLYNFDYGFATPYPGTELYDYAKAHGFIPNENEYLMGQLCSPRTMSDKINERHLKRYLAKNNFNNLSSKKLFEIKKAVQRCQIKNRFYYTHRTFHDILKLIPLSINIFLGWLFLKKVTRFIFLDIRTFPLRLSKKLRSA